MKIVLATFGSRGDVQPMLALSLALQSQRHAVLLAGPPETAAWAQQLGCPYAPLGADVTACIDGMDNAYSLSSAIRFMSLLRDGIKSQFAFLPAIVAGADLVVGSSLVFALASVAEAMGITYRYIAFTPQLLPSGGHPFPAVKTQWLPHWFNRWTWWAAKMLDQVNIRRLINSHRRQMGLNPVTDAWLHILGDKVIVASDPAISGVPPDVASPAVVQTGYMHLSQPNLKSDSLAEFTAAGPPPVYAGFGSMPMRDQIRGVATIVQAARLAGQRAVISKFWDGPTEFDRADDIFFIQKFPHLYLFPQMAAVIHHGGAGTTAATAISGRPQIIVPHILDQYYWGWQVHTANLGPRPIWRSRVTVKKLAEAITVCMSNDKMKQKAVAIADMIRQTNGSALTVSELVG